MKKNGRMISIRLKLIVYFITVIFLPFGTLGILGPLLYSKSIESETTNHAIQMIGQLNLNIEFYVRETEKLVDFLYRDGNVERFFDDDRANPAVDTSVRLLLGNVKASHREIAGILLENDRDSMLSNELYRITRDPLTDEQWYLKAVASPDAVKLFSKPIGRNVRNNLNLSADDVVSVVKAVRDSSGKVRGVIMIDLRLEVLENIFVDTTLGKSGFFFITDSQGGIVYAPVNSVIYRIPPAWLSDSRDSTVRRVGESRYQLLFQYSGYTGWKTVGVFSINELLKEIDFLLFYSLLMAVATLLAAVVIAFVLASSIARPVVKLRSLMKQVEEGNLDVSFESDKNDEISQLGRSFNVMIEEIRNLIQQVYREQQMKREAELKTLQEQIKPHFLYNTLDTIQYMAQSHGDDDIVEVVGALTRLFRIGLSKGKEMIRLSDEIEHVKNYLFIEKVRYEDKLDYRIEFDEALGNFRVIKLILQPLVENAIYHGIKQRRGNGFITVEVARESDVLVMKITDDGIGMKREQVETLEAMFATDDNSNHGFGLYNVNERIKLTFGPGWGLKIISEYGEGTTIEVRCPVVPQEA